MPLVSRRAGVLLFLAAIALLGMALNSPVIESVTFRSVDKNGKPGTEAATTINAPYVRMTHSNQEVTVDLFYRGYGNTVMRFKALYCFGGASFRINGAEYPFPKGVGRCRDVIVDLAGLLHSGANTVTFTSYDLWGKSGIAAGPVLFGGQIYQSLFTLLFIGSLLGLVYSGLRRQGFDKAAGALFIEGCLFYLQWLNYTPHFWQATNDLLGHAAHIQYVSDHFFRPYGVTGWESHQPPTYYWICALVAKVFALFGVFDVWTGIRLVALLSYCVFVYFGMRTMKLVLHGGAFYLALALLIFWPAGILLYVTHINNDVLLYPLYAASFYYLLVWYETDDITALSKALILCGAGFAVKTSAITPAAIIAVAALFKLGWRNLALLTTRKGMASGVIALGAGLSINLGWILYGLCHSQSLSVSEYFNGAGFPNVLHASFLPWEKWISLRDLFAHPYFEWWHREYAWNIYWKTMLFNWGNWHYPALAACLHALALFMCLYAVVFMVTRSGRQYRQLFPLLAGYVMPPLVILGFYVLNRIKPAFDFRYVYPAIIVIIITFLLAVQETRVRGRLVLYYTGNTIAVSFVALSIALFLLQMHGH